MKSLLLIALLIPLSVFAADDLVRNPFWPQGFEGRRYAITVAPRYPTRNEPLADELMEYKLKPGETLKTVTNSLGIVTQIIESEEPRTDELEIEQPPQKSSIQIENELWAEARKELRSSNGLSYEDNGVIRHCFTVNGLVYADGDLISANCGTNRFTWRIIGMSTNNTMRVARMKRRELTEKDAKIDENNQKSDLTNENKVNK